MRLSCALAAAAVLASLWIPRPARATEDASYAAGVREANTEIAEGRPTIYRLGFGSTLAKDGDTGLPIRSIAGCTIDLSALRRARGHNDRIHEYLAHAPGTGGNLTLAGHSPRSPH